MAVDDVFEELTIFNLDIKKAMIYKILAIIYLLSI